MRYKIVFGVVLAMLLGGLFGAVVHFFRPTTAPWEQAGSLVVIVHPAPGKVYDTTLGFGIDDMTLHRTDGEQIRATVLTRRVVFDQAQENLHILLDTDVPTGTYSGFGFTLTSPELRNAWEQDVAPASVSLLFEELVLPSPYEVKENETTVILLGFETIQAIHKQSDGDIYLPVIRVETRSGALVTDANGVVHVEGGTISTNATFGMDWSGHMRQNFRAKTPPLQE